MAPDRTDSSPAGQLVTRLNTMVAKLVGENRRLRRELEKLSQRATAARATKKAATRRPARPARRVAKKRVAAPKRAAKRTTRSASAPRGRRAKTKAPTRKRRR